LSAADAGSTESTVQTNVIKTAAINRILVSSSSPSLRGAPDKIAKQFCSEATKQSSSSIAAPWIASLRSQ
jgi:hypothetical protein